MAIIYRDSDADLGLLMDKRIAVIGYGNMGRAIALNLRDSAFPLVIGNQADTYAEQAYRDGFEVKPILEAVTASNLILLLLPDEIAGQIYLQHVAPRLQPDDTLVFASGYTVAFGFIEPPPFVDVALVAPQATAEGVRAGYVEGKGFPSFISIGQDASGEAWARALAVAKALGALHRGAIELSFKQEAELDLFTQQALLPALHGALQTAMDVLNREGFPPEAILTSLYLSGELGFTLTKWSEIGLLASMALHSRTQQYGTLSRIDRFKEVKLKHQMEAILDSIRRGDFAQEWATEQADGYPRLEALLHRMESTPLRQHEQQILTFLNNETTPPKD